MENRHEHTQEHIHEQMSQLHKHVHSEEEKKKVVNRLSKAIGHLEAVKQTAVTF